MSTYICVERNGEAATYRTDTDQERERARQALRDAGLQEADIYVGEPDGLGDSYRSGAKLFSEVSNWVVLCKRTNDPKLAWLEYRLEGAGIRCRRNGESFHAPILEVDRSQEEEAWAILDLVDEIPDDDPAWAEGALWRDAARAERGDSPCGS